MVSYTQYHSPVGSITVAAEEGCIILLDFCQPTAGAQNSPDDPVLQLACRWLDRYFACQRPDPAELPLRLKGTAFQQQVWKILQSIPYGASVTYGFIAKHLGKTMSAQAVGSAVGKNPISIVVPCHRVLGRNGKLTGYAGGLDRKKFLLELENIPYTQ